MEGTKEDIVLKYVMLSNMRGIGAVTQNILLDKAEGIRELFSFDEEKDHSLKASLEIKLGRARLSLFLAQRNDKTIENTAKDIVKAAREEGMDIVVREDINFPKRLKDMRDMPILLYTKGKLSINNNKESVGIVGARRCSGYGKLEAIKIAAAAVSDGSAVISGMAKGIDSYAHTSALKEEGYTIAVLGNGADICYPKEHEKLYETIIKKGCILTEYPPGTSPRQYNFPRRNRIIAGLSDRLYVIDANRKSGTGSTVDYAKKYEREVTKL